MLGNHQHPHLLGDHLGSTLTFKANTYATTTQLYKPWGEVRYTSGTLPTQSTYTGQYSHTADFGLMYYNARWYDPYLNRFIQPDSIVPDQNNPMAWDRYAYGLNNPVRYSDPSGHFYYDPGCECMVANGVPEYEYKENLTYERDYNEDEGDPLKWLKARLEFRDFLGDVSSGVSLSADTIGLLLSFQEVVVVDGAYAFLTGAGCLVGGIGGCGEGFAAGWAFEKLYMSDANPMAKFEDWTGNIGFAATFAADYFYGNTQLLEGQIGVDTVVSLRNAFAGQLPEANVDFAVSLSQFKYDADRYFGVKPGGSVNIFSLEFIAQFVWKDW